MPEPLSNRHQLDVHTAQTHAHTLSNYYQCLFSAHIVLNAKNPSYRIQRGAHSTHTNTQNQNVPMSTDGTTDLAIILYALMLAARFCVHVLTHKYTQSRAIIMRVELEHRTRQSHLIGYIIHIFHTKYINIYIQMCTQNANKMPFLVLVKVQHRLSTHAQLSIVTPAHIVMR